MRKHLLHRKFPLLFICLLVVMNVANALDMGGRPGGFFNGMIDEVRFYNRTLTQAEIQADMNSNYPFEGDGLLASYGFNAGTGTIAYDTHNRVQGKSKSAIYFDGINDFIDFGNIAIADFGTGDFTVEFWIKSEDLTGEIITNMNPSRDSWGIGINNASYGGFYMDHTGGTFTTNNPSEFGPVMANINDGSWHHIEVKRLNGTIQGFKNSVGSNTFTNANPLNSPESLYIARNVRTGFLKGTVDEVKIWNTTDTAVTVAVDERIGLVVEVVN